MRYGRAWRFSASGTFHLSGKPLRTGRASRTICAADGSRLKALPLLWAEYRAGKKLLKARKFDAINSNWLIPSGLLFARLAGIFAARHIVTVHAADYFMLQRIPLGKSLIKYIARHSRALIPVNEKMAAGIKEIAPGAKVMVMPMGFDPAKFRQVDGQEVEKLREGLGVKNKKVVLFVGKLAEKKGLDNLLEAMKILEKDFNNCYLLVVGRGGWKAHLEKHASKLDVMYRVKFLGAMPHEKIPLYYQLADVVAIPSLPDRHGESEGMPVVLLEGIASGKPVVGTSFCSAPGPLKEGGGFFETADASPQALAQELKNVLKGENVEDFSKVDQFRWPEVARFYAEVISNA